MKTPTTAQAMSIIKIATDKGLDRQQFQELIDGGNIARLMDRKVSLGKGIKIHKLKSTVHQDMDWIKSVHLAGPDTPSNYSIWESGYLYSPVSDKEEKNDYVLVNFSKGNGSWDKALEYAKDNNLELTNPREANAVASKNNLIKDLEIKKDDWIHIVSTTSKYSKGHKHTCCVFQNYSYSKTVLHKVSKFDNSNSWFLFRKKTKY